MTRGVCSHCHEPVLDTDKAVKQSHLDRPRDIDPTYGAAWEVTERWTHRNCDLRMIVGSIGHQLGLCGCKVKDGTAIEDPPGLTRRQSADLAARLFDRLQRR